MKLSFTNLAGTATVTASSEDPAYPATNARTPQRPFLPSKTLALGSQSWVIDFTAPTVLSLVGLVHVNFTSARWQGNATDAWGAPSYDEAVTISRCPWNWRYQNVFLPTGFNYRFARLYVPNQATTDGATIYRLGGIWAGVATTPPSYWRWQMAVTTVLPRTDVAPQHQGWRQRLVLGDPIIRITAAVAAQVDRASPGKGDDLATWQGLMRQVWAADVFWLALDKGDDAAAWPVRRVDDVVWTVDAGLAEAPWELEEAVAP